jgi:glycosyltransferase involved in cell wall biosynthesis
MEHHISIVTVTKDRPSFVGHLRSNIEGLDYDRELIEWVVVDDGTQTVFDIVRGFPNLKYVFSGEHIPLGRKRNLANSLTTGSVVFNFDDDNYAFSTRIKAALTFLDANPDCQIVGSSEMFVLDISIGKVYVSGPFAGNHATLGTWAFRRTVLDQTKFRDEDSSGEESGFTRGWKIPVAQLDKHHTSVCVDHGRNTVSKKHLLRQAPMLFEVRDVITNEFSRRYFEGLIACRNSE